MKPLYRINPSDIVISDQIDYVGRDDVLPPRIRTKLWLGVVLLVSAAVILAVCLVI